MTDQTPLINHDDLDKQFTKAELRKFFVGCCLMPWVIFGPIFVGGAFFRTYPAFPPLWRGFWMTEITFTVAYITIFFLLRDHPRIVRVRMRKLKPDSSDSPQEQGFARLGTAIAVPGYLLIPWDAVARADTFPLLWNIVGSIFILFSIVWTAIVFRQNKFATRVVFKQESQQLVTTGLYRLVRHPMYLGMIPLFLGLPLCAGSYWGLIPMGMIVLLIGYRTFSEEEFLVSH